MAIITTELIRKQSVGLMLFVITTSFSAAQSRGDSRGDLEGTVAFSSLAPRSWDVFLQAVNEVAAPLTEHGALDFNAAFSPDGQTIAFVSHRDGNLELYRINRDGSDLRRLTHDVALDDHPTWSADGRQIAFVSTRQAAPAGRAWNAIYVMDADGSNVHRLSPTDASDYSPAWSSRGDLLAFASGSGEPGRSDIYLMSSDGRRRRRIVENGGWPTFIEEGRAIAFHSRREESRWDVWRVDIDGSNLQCLAKSASMPRATPDGTKVALVIHGSDQQIGILDLHTDSLAEITQEPTDHWNPTIAPDGTTVAYHKSAERAVTTNVELWSAPADTKLNLLRLDGAFPAFSPDQKRVAFTSQGFSQVDVMELDGSQRHTIFSGTRRSLFGVSWAHEPERIAFSHGVVFGDASASVNIKSVSPGGEDLTSLTDDAGNNGFPSYAPDGTQLVFRSGRDGPKNLYIMDRDGNNVRRLTDGDWTDTMCDWCRPASGSPLPATATTTSKSG